MTTEQGGSLLDELILPGVLGGIVGAIPSKSQAHRALICAALADSQTRIECRGTSKDIEATANCLSALGAGIRRDIEGFYVLPCRDGCLLSGVMPLSPVLPCGESGSTFRFMLPIASALGMNASFELEGRLPERPISPLYEVLLDHGCVLSPQGSSPFCISGRLLPGQFTLDAGVSSQFISGLLFALPLLDGDSELRLTGNVESFPYIELTMEMLKTFGITVEFKDMIFSIPGGQVYRSPGTVRVEGDWSNAAFWLAAGAIGGAGMQVVGDCDTNKGCAVGVTCTGLDLQSLQGDRAVLDILEQFGAKVVLGDSSVTVSGGELRGIEIDARDIPDLVPILSVVAVAAKGVTKIHNAGRLRGKESDRLAAVASVFGGLGAEIHETEDGLRISGGIPLIGGEASSWGDHRIAMSAAIAAILCSEPVMIHGAEAVDKSYPGFFEERRRLACLHNMEGR